MIYHSSDSHFVPNKERNASEESLKVVIGDILLFFFFLEPISFESILTVCGSHVRKSCRHHTLSLTTTHSPGLFILLHVWAGRSLLCITAPCVGGETSLWLHHLVPSARRSARRSCRSAGGAVGSGRVSVSGLRGRQLLPPGLHGRHLEGRESGKRQIFTAQ